MKEKLIEFIENNLDVDCKIDVEKLLEKPKAKEHGDFSFPCFILAKELKQAPPQIAKELENKFLERRENFIAKIVAMGPFLNFYLNSNIENKEVFDKFESGEALEFKVESPKKIAVESPSPNANKSLHIGHTRNILIGNALVHILKKVGNEVIRTNINNDRGIAVCKSMISYQLFGEGKTPESENMKGDEFVSYYYVLYGKKNEEQPELELDRKAQEMLVKWEEGDKEVRELWETIQNFVYSGYKETYKNYKLDKIDGDYYESQIYDKGKEIVVDALEKGVEGFEKDETGAIFVDLEDKGYGKKYLLRGDGTTLYMTQDLFLANLKEKELKCDKEIFVVGVEQEYHFQVLFELLDRLNLAKKENNFHFAYGFVYDENGKKYSSRNGEVVTADWILEESINKARENLLNKENSKGLSEEEVERRANIIGYGALAFSILKANPLSSINFSIEKSLSFEGETGPYVQYTYARIQSLLRKAEYKRNNNINFEVFEEKESSLIKILKDYSNVLEEASSKYKISAIANFLIKVCQSFNEFYQNCHIVSSEDEELKKARLLLCENTSLILKDGLSLLGIEVLDEM